MLSLLSAIVLAAPDAAAEDLLRTATIVRSPGAPNAIRMTDGKAPIDGDNWDTVNTAVLAASGEIVWDFSSVRHIGGLRLQADNNDTYTVSASNDGERWSTVWAAKPVGVPGMQTRTSEPLDFLARYLRVTAAGGDNLFSVGEFEAFETATAMASATVQRIVPPPPPPPPPINTGLLVVLAVAGYGAWLLNDARRTNLARSAGTSAPPK
jgi:hypothetical protein